MSRTKFTNKTITNTSVKRSASKSLLIDSIQTKDSMTANGMEAHSTTSSSVLDMFFLSGASRNLSESDIINLWVKAVNEDANLAYKALFYSGDVRGGQGERRFFRTVLKYAYENDYDRMKVTIPYILEFRRADDLLFLMADAIEKKDGKSKKISKNDISLKWDDTKIFSIIIDGLREGNGLIAKWMPRKGIVFNALCERMKLTPKNLRKLLVRLTKEANVVEQLMCAGKWSSIEFSKVSSKAFNIYKKAFEKHDSTRFEAFVEKAVKGEVKINTSVLYPEDVIGEALNLGITRMSKTQTDAVIAQWNQLPDFIGRKKNENFISIVDVSGSMGDRKKSPYSVAVSIGMYLAERNTGIFQDAFITFSNTPRLQYLKGNVIERLNQFDRGFAENTDLNKALRLILTKAVDANLPEAEMPKAIVIISDMQFDSCMGNTATEMIEREYRNAGYSLPKIVFWNVNGSVGTNPAKSNSKNVNMVSGYSPNIMKQVLETLSKTPYELMVNTLNSARYESINVK